MDTIKLSDAEWKIMRLLWAQEPLTYKEIEDALKAETGWSKHTVLSFLKRMTEKGAIAARDTKPAKQYHTIVAQDALTHEETKSFTEKVFGGSLGLLTSALTAQAVTAEELDDMIAMLQEAKDRQSK